MTKDIGGEELPEPEIINDIKVVDNLDHNMVVESTTVSEKGVQTNETSENIDNLRRENEHLKKQLAGVKRIFSENQIKKMDSQKRINWSVSEISNTISMFAAGPRAYRLNLKRGFPRPHTLKKNGYKKLSWTQGFKKKTLQIAELANMSDEMKVRKEYQYDQAKDCGIKPYDYVQVVLIKGILSS